MLINIPKGLITFKQIRETKLGFVIPVLHYKNYVTMVKKVSFFAI